MTTLYAWNTARADSVAYPNVREARLFHPTRGRQFFGLFDTPLPQQKDTPIRNTMPLSCERCFFMRQPSWLQREPTSLKPHPGKLNSQSCMSKPKSIRLSSKPCYF